MPIPKKLFVSHSATDRKFVGDLASVLRLHKVPFWYSRSHLVGAQQWHDEIGAALRRCDWFLLILSPDAVKSMWVKRELLYALRSRRYRDHIIPALYKRCAPEKLSWTLPDFQIVNFSRRFEQGCRDLLKIWGVRYAKPGRLPLVRKKRLRRRS